MKNNIRTEVELLGLFEELMKKRNFIVHREPLISGSMRPDFILEKDNKKFVVEIKNVTRIKPRSVYQIISYLLKDKTFEGGYLAVPFYTKISPFVEKELKKKGIGLIRFEKDKLQFIEEPKEKSFLLNSIISDSSKKIFDKRKIPKSEWQRLVEDIAQKVAENFDKSLEKKEIKNFPKNILIFVIIASLIGSSLWSMIQFFIDSSNNKIISLLVSVAIFIILILILIIYYFYERKKYAEGSEDD